jgi:hypothetical protein
MSSDPGEFSPSTPASTPAPSSQPQSAPQTFEQQRQAQDRARTPPAPRTRQPQAPNPNVSRGEGWPHGLDAEGRYRTAAEARRTDAEQSGDGPAAEPGARAAPGDDRTSSPPTDNKIKIGDREYLEADLHDAVAELAAKQSRELSRPQRAEDFKFGLSPNFTPPAGLDFKLDEKDPAVAMYREFAVKNGFTQDQFTEGLDLVASLRVGEAHQMNVLKKAEVAKLGAAGTQRVDAVARWMTGTMGPAAGPMARILAMCPVADTVVAFESLIQKIQTQGSGSYSPTGRRVEDGDGKIAGYDSMTFAQKRAAQDDMNRRR